MKKLQLLLAISILLISCGPQSNNVTVTHQQPSNIQAQVSDLPGFDVNAFSSLLKTTGNPDAIQQAINAPGNSINNLDLDGDGNIDYLKVDQINNYTIQVIDETGSNSKEVIATLTVNPQNNSYAIQGSQNYCGNNYYYNSPQGITFGQFLFLNWLLTPHSYYHPYWGYHSGYYRGYSAYHSHYSRPYSRSYIQERKSYRTTTTTTRNSTPSVNRITSTSNSSQSITRNSVASPNKSQRSFSTSNNSGGSISSGFGRSSSSSSSSTSSNSSRSSFGSSRSSSFGGGRSSCGGGRRR